MKRMKKLTCILLFLCSAWMACNWEDPIRFDFGEKRLVPVRLSNAEWKPCCVRPPEIRASCLEPNSRKAALELLVVAGGECLDNTLRAIEKHSPEDLAAAHLIRAHRKKDPVDLLRALKTAKGFNRALAQELLGLKTEAIHSWDQVVSEGSEWSDEALRRRNRLMNLREPADQTEELERALQRRDRDTITRIAQAFPYDVAVFFLEQSDLLDRQGALLLSDVLAEGGEPYPKAIVTAMERAADRDTLEHGIRALRKKDYERAATLLEQVENPLHLHARYCIAALLQADALPLLDSLVPITPPRYLALSFRIRSLRATALEYQDRYLDAHTAYKDALRFAPDATRRAAVLNRWSANYTTIGSPDKGLRDALIAISLLPHVASLKEAHLVYGSAAKAALALGYEQEALHYQNAAVQAAQKAVTGTADHVRAKHLLAVGLRERANIHVDLGNSNAAEADLKEAEELAEAAELRDLGPLLRLRAHEVRGDMLLATNPREADASFTEAIKLAAEQDSTYRAVLYFKRAAARRGASQPHADDDVAVALKILRDEAKLLLDMRKPGDYEELWTQYFSRFQTMQHAVIEDLIARNEIERAFVLAEQGRAFEPMHVLLHLQSAPPGFRRIETRQDLHRHLAALPEDTVILQYAVLPEKTYAWVLTRRGGIELVSLRPGRDQIARWQEEVREAILWGQSDVLIRVMRAVYGELFRAPLALSGGAPRIVIVPDGPMHGLPFAGLQGTNRKYLIEERIISGAGSTTLYFYARARDAQFAQTGDPSVLLVGNPAFDPRTGRPELAFALPEVQELRRAYYPGAELLAGAEATVSRFLAAAKNATIVHFAGHGIANPQNPWKSRLLLAPFKDEPGELTAERLMRELSELERTRLVVLGACSSAGGQPVGPEGLAPLVRPLIAANVPAVVGTLWDVNDATSKDLLVSLHCHYRHGDDVAVALRAAQLERLRTDPLTAWAAFQVVGYAGSPYVPLAPMEKPHSDSVVCTQNSLHRPDGLHPQ